VSVVSCERGVLTSEAFYSHNSVSITFPSDTSVRIFFRIFINRNVVLYPLVEDIVGTFGRADPTGGGTGV
jgi:hypothetical protein